MVVCLDGEWPNPYKAGEDARRIAAAPKYDHDAFMTLDNQLAGMQMDTPEFETTRLLAGKELQKIARLSMIRKEMVRLLLHEIQKPGNERIIVVMAGVEAEATAVKLARDIGGCVVFTPDGDAASFGAAFYINKMSVKVGALHGTVIDVNQALTSSTFVCKATNIKGAMSTFHPFEFEAMNVIHGACGSDFSSIGGSASSRGVYGVQNKTALSLLLGEAERIRGAPHKKAALRICFDAIFNSDAWCRAVAELSGPQQQAKRREFENGVLYFYLGPAVTLMAPNPGVPLLEALLTRTARARIDHVNHPANQPPLCDAAIRAQFLAGAPQQFNEEIFFCRAMLADDLSKRVTDHSSYYPYCGFPDMAEAERNRFYRLADMEVIKSLARMLRIHFQPSVSRLFLVNTVKNRLLMGLKPENIADTGIVYAPVEFENSQVLAGRGSSTNFVSWCRQSHFTSKPGGTGFHPFFERGGLPEATPGKATSVTGCLRAIRLVLGGHLMLNRVQVIKGETLKYGPVVCCEVTGVLPSLKSDPYVTQATYAFPPDGVPSTSPIFIEELSGCSCVAGATLCSHILGVNLFAATVAKIVESLEDDADDDDEKLYARVLGLLPVEAKLAQGQVTRLDAIFRRNADGASSSAGIAGESSDDDNDNEEVAVDADGFDDNDFGSVEGDQSDGDAANDAASEEPSPSDLSADVSEAELIALAGSPDCYAGNILDKLVDIIMDGKHHTGFGGVVHAKEFDADATPDVQEVDDLKRAAPALFDLLVISGAHKKAKVQDA